MSKRRNRIIFELCFVVFVAWIALLFVIFRDKPKKTPGKGMGTTPVPTVPGDPPSPAPDGRQQVFLLKSEYRTRDGERKLYRTYQYDTDGRVVSCAYEGQSGEYTYEYSDIMHLVTEISPVWEVFEGEKHKTETVYAPNGQEIIRAEYRIRESDGGLDTVSVMEWDEAGRITRYYSCDNDQDLYYDEITEYDANGYIISDRVKYSAEEEWRVVGYGICDEQGRVVRFITVDGQGEDALKTLSIEVSYNGDGSREEKRYIGESVYMRRFDAEGREVYTEWYDGSETGKEYQIHTYTDDMWWHTRESKLYRADGTLVNTLVTRYNDEGYVIFQKRTDADGTETVFVEQKYDYDSNLIDIRNGVERKLEYDEYGNLIRETKTVVANGEPWVTVREFEYYAIQITNAVAEENAMYYNPATQALNFEDETDSRIND